MADELDPIDIGIQLDRAEDAGLIGTAAAAWLRGLTRREADIRRWLALQPEGAPTPTVVSMALAWIARSGPPPVLSEPDHGR